MREEANLQILRQRRIEACDKFASSCAALDTGSHLLQQQENQDIPYLIKKNMLGVIDKKQSIVLYASQIEWEAREELRPTLQTLPRCLTEYDLNRQNHLTLTPFKMYLSILYTRCFGSFCSLAYRQRGADLFHY